MTDVKVDVVKKGNEYALKVTKDKKTAEVPLQGVKTAEEAESIKTALLAEINKAEVDLPRKYSDKLKEYLGRIEVPNKDLILMNSVGIIDSGFRGEVSFKYRMKGLHDLNRKNANDITILRTYSVSDRIGQMMIIPYPKIEFEEVNELSESKRGHGGYGSTGK